MIPYKSLAPKGLAHRVEKPRRLASSAADLRPLGGDYEALHVTARIGSLWALRPGGGPKKRGRERREEGNPDCFLVVGTHLEDQCVKLLALEVGYNGLIRIDPRDLRKDAKQARSKWVHESHLKSVRAVRLTPAKFRLLPPSKPAQELESSEEYESEEALSEEEESEAAMSLYWEDSEHDSDDDESDSSLDEQKGGRRRRLAEDAAGTPPRKDIAAFGQHDGETTLPSSPLALSENVWGSELLLDYRERQEQRKKAQAAEFAALMSKLNVPNMADEEAPPTQLNVGYVLSKADDGAPPKQREGEHQQGQNKRSEEAASPTQKLQRVGERQQVQNKGDEEEAPCTQLQREGERQQVQNVAKLQPLLRKAAPSKTPTPPQGASTPASYADALTTGPPSGGPPLSAGSHHRRLGWTAVEGSSTYHPSFIAPPQSTRTPTSADGAPGRAGVPSSELSGKRTLQRGGGGEGRAGAADPSQVAGGICLLTNEAMPDFPGQAAKGKGESGGRSLLSRSDDEEHTGLRLLSELATAQDRSPSAAQRSLRAPGILGKVFVFGGQGVSVVRGQANLPGLRKHVTAAVHEVKRVGVRDKVVAESAGVLDVWGGAASGGGGAVERALPESVAAQADSAEELHVSSLLDQDTWSSFHGMPGGGSLGGTPQGTPQRGGAGGNAVGEIDVETWEWYYGPGGGVGGSVGGGMELGDLESPTKRLTPVKTGKRPREPEQGRASDPASKAPKSSPAGICSPPIPYSPKPQGAVSPATPQAHATTEISEPALTVGLSGTKASSPAQPEAGQSAQPSSVLNPQGGKKGGMFKKPSSRNRCWSSKKRWVGHLKSKEGGTQQPLALQNKQAPSHVPSSSSSSSSSHTYSSSSSSAPPPPLKSSLKHYSAAPDSSTSPFHQARAQQAPPPAPKRAPKENAAPSAAPASQPLSLGRKHSAQLKAGTKPLCSIFPRDSGKGSAHWEGNAPAAPAPVTKPAGNVRPSLAERLSESQFGRVLPPPVQCLSPPRVILKPIASLYMGEASPRAHEAEVSVSPGWRTMPLLQGQSPISEYASSTLREGNGAGGGAGGEAWGTFEAREEQRGREAVGGHGVCHCAECEREIEEYLADSDLDVQEWP